jgi:hypothetical protein
MDEQRSVKGFLLNKGFAVLRDRSLNEILYGRLCHQAFETMTGINTEA